MKVEFHKTSERQYAVVVKREGRPPVRIDPAPGFDEFLPHDLVHFVVEQELGLRNAIYGQLDAGGTAGSFRLDEPSAKSKSHGRARRKSKKVGQKLLKSGMDDSYRSERATFVCWHDWLSHSEDDKLRGLAAEMSDEAKSIFGQMPASERQQFDEPMLLRIRKRFDEFSSRWSSAKAGEFVTLEW